MKPIAAVVYRILDKALGGVIEPLPQILAALVAFGGPGPTAIALRPHGQTPIPPDYAARSCRRPNIPCDCESHAHNSFGARRGHGERVPPARRGSLPT
jgi:hypothetical protein